MVKLPSLRRKKEPKFKEDAEPIFPDYPKDNRKPTGRRTVVNSIKQPQPKPLGIARPREELPLRPPTRREMEAEAPEPEAYYEEPEPEELAEQEEQPTDPLNDFADYLLNNNLIEEFYALLQEKIELRNLYNLYNKMQKAREVYGRSKKIAQ